MTRLRQTIAKRLKDAQNTAAMLTTYNEVDMTEVMALQETSTRTSSRRSTACAGLHVLLHQGLCATP
jgi:2-oxoglutarate dehydrogenase E2 component (dihydrolipoamide succinyltransferase)